MGILKKIKSIFFQEEEKPIIAVEPTIITDETKPKGEIIGTCVLCSKPIGADDRTRDLNGTKCHKRCAKKAIKQVLQGGKL
jgi:hypothetical protein